MVGFATTASRKIWVSLNYTMEAVLSLCKRHPMNQFELRSFLASRNVENIEKLVQEIENDEKINVIDYKGIKTYRLK